LYDGFAYLETEQETLTLSAFRFSIIKLGVKMVRCSMDRVFLFFKRYNLSGNDMLSFSEFVKCILPCNQMTSLILKNRPSKFGTEIPSQGKKVKIEYFLKEKFANLVDLIIDLEIETEIIRQKLKNREEFSAQKAFNTLC